MKKILMVLLALICCISLIGCGADPKKEAERLNTEYYTNIKSIFEDWSKNMDPIVHSNQNFQDSNIQVSQITRDKTLPALTDLKSKFDKEKFPDDLKPLQNSLNNLFVDMFNFYAQWSEPDGFFKMGPQNATVELLRLSNNILNSRLRYENEYSIIKNGKSNYKLDLEHYNKIKQGDSYAEVANILGMPGQLTYSSQGGYYWSESYEWVLDKKRISAKFENNKLKIISQFNLQ